LSQVATNRKSPVFIGFLELVILPTQLDAITQNRKIGQELAKQIGASNAINGLNKADGWIFADLCANFV